MAVYCSLLMHYFLLVIFYAGTHLVTSTPLLRFQRGWFDLLYAWRGLFGRGISGIWKILQQSFCSLVCF